MVHSPTDLVTNTTAGQQQSSANLVKRQATPLVLSNRPVGVPRFATGEEARRVYLIKSKTERSAKTSGRMNRIRYTPGPLKGPEQPQQQQNNVLGKHKRQILG